MRHGEGILIIFLPEHKSREVFPKIRTLVLVFINELNFTSLRRNVGQCKHTKQNNAKHKNTKLLNILFLRLLFRR